MGIRVHKLIGYGLIDVKSKNLGEIIDERFNLNIVNSDEFNESLYETDLEEWIQWSLNNIDILKEYQLHEKGTESIWEFGFLDKESKNLPYIYDLFVRPSEMMMDNVMVFLPASCANEWQRYDDVIDWVEEGFDNRVVLLNEKCKNGIFPFNSMLTRCSPHSDPKCELAKKNNLPSNEMFFLKNVAKTEEDKYDLKNNWRPSIPIEIISFILWTNIFKNPKEIINSLRPLLYVYWS